MIALLLEVLGPALPALGLVTAGLAVAAGSAAMVRIVQLARQPEHPREAWVRHVRRELRDTGHYDDASVSVVRLRRGVSVCRNPDGLHDSVAWSDLDRVLRDHWNEQWALAAAELEYPHQLPTREQFEAALAEAREPAIH